MKALSTLFIISLISYAARAQEIDYTIEQNEPEYSNFVLGFEPFYIDASKLNFPIGVGVSGMYHGIVDLSFVVNRSLFDLNTYSMNATNSLKPHSAFEIGVGYPLINKVVDKPLRITLSETTVGDYTYSKFIMVPGSIKRTVGVRGGIYRYRNSYSNDDFGDIEMDSVTMVASSLGYDPGVNQWEPFLANVTVTALYGGISITGTRNLRITSESFSGHRKNAGFSHVYIDAMFAPFINLGSYTHVPVPGDIYNLLPAGNYDLNDSYSKRRIGFRLGWQGNQALQMGKKSRIGFYYRMEAGSRPGIKGGNWYMLLATGIGLNGKI